MKEIYAIIRLNKVYNTKKALEEIGFPSITVFNYRVFGRGKQKGIIDEVTFSVSPEVSQLAKQGGMKYIPKRLVYLVVDDKDITGVVDAIIQANQTGHYGDGRIFVCPVEDAIRIRTEEKGAQALLKRREPCGYHIRVMTRRHIFRSVGFTYRLHLFVTFNAVFVCGV